MGLQFYFLYQFISILPVLRNRLLGSPTFRWMHFHPEKNWAKQFAHSQKHKTGYMITIANLLEIHHRQTPHLHALF